MKKKKQKKNTLLNSDSSYREISSRKHILKIEWVGHPLSVILCETFWPQIFASKFTRYRSCCQFNPQKILETVILSEAQFPKSQFADHTIHLQIIIIKSPLTNRFSAVVRRIQKCRSSRSREQCFSHNLHSHDVTSKVYFIASAINKIHNFFYTRRNILFLSTSAKCNAGVEIWLLTISLQLS